MNNSRDIWILAEQFAGVTERISFELLTRGLELKEKANCRLNAMLFADKISDSELQKLTDCGADSVAVVESPLFSAIQPETAVAAFLQIVREYSPSVVLAGATTLGRILLPYAAMQLHTGLTADCTKLDIDPETGILLQTRPAIGGNIMATIKCEKFRPQMATVRPRSTAPAQPAAGRKGEIRRMALDFTGTPRSRQLGFTAAAETSGIQQASRLVVVGRGIRKVETLEMIRELADLLDARVAGTREAVDRGWLEYPCQIGLSGKTVTPDFYLGIGVSGAIQHLAGMQTAKTIAAINSDPEAQIFQVADFGICGNLFEVVPALIAEIKKGGSPWK